VTPSAARVTFPHAGPPEAARRLSPQRGRARARVTCGATASYSLQSGRTLQPSSGGIPVEGEYSYVRVDTPDGDKVVEEQLRSARPWHAKATISLQPGAYKLVSYQRLGIAELARVTFPHTGPRSSRAPQVTGRTHDSSFVQDQSIDKRTSNTAVGTLISASCTTGWLDWIHGDLWLLPDGLLRVRSGLEATIEHANQRTVLDDGDQRQFGVGELERLQGEHKSNLWIPADEIVSAGIRNGPLSGRLALTLKGGRRVKLMWLRADRASEPLKKALASWGIPL
jgi:hypothetical protein